MMVREPPEIRHDSSPWRETKHRSSHIRRVYRRTLQAMPETLVTPKSTSSLSPLTSSREESNRFSVERKITRCVSHKFHTYTQLPIRCHRPSPYYRPPRTTFRLPGLTTLNRARPISIAKSCPDDSTCSSILRAIGAAGCRKSLSMIDFSLSATEAENGDLRSDSSSTVEKLEEGDKIKDNDVGVGIRNWLDGFVSAERDERGSRFFQNPRKAASLVSRVLVLNAWRRRRSEVLYLRDTIDALSQQVDHLRLQIVVLRRLLDTENSRVGRLTGEVHRAKMQLDEAQKERDTLKTDKEKLDGEMNRCSELSEQRRVTAENLRNELFTAKDQIQALDQQISRNQEKLTKLREDKKILLEKVTASETLATERGARAEKAESAAEELQLKLATQIALVESSQEKIQRYSKELKMKEDERFKLERRLKSSEETGRSLNLRTVFLEAQLADKQAALRRVESAYDSQLTELHELRERLIRQSQEGGWSSRMLQIAGTVVRAPGAILRTLLSTTGPVLTP